MKKTIFIIVLGVWIINAYAQIVSDQQTSQSVASLFDDKSKEEPKKTLSSLTIGAGPAWITSKVYTNRGQYTRQPGMEIMAEYNCVYSKGFGFGLTIAYNHTSYTVDANLNQLFFGPSFVYAGYIGKRMWAKVDVGLGYAGCDDGLKLESGVGVKTGLSFNYMISPQIGIGAHLLSFSSTFGDQPGSDDVNGIARLGIAIGLRFHY